MLGCKDITEQANAYLDRDLPFTKRFGVRMHLFICAHCRRYMDQLHVTIETLGRMTKDETLSEQDSKRLLECFKKEQQTAEKSPNNAQPNE